jgi:uncharacterized protein YndB with AHSA1/START domain
MPPDVVDNTVEHATLIRAPRERVFDAFATARGLNEWFTTDTRITDDAHIEFRWKEWGPQKFTGADGGPIVGNRRPERFVFLWSHHGSKWRSMVELNFTEFPDGTLVKLKESGFPDTKAGRAIALTNASRWGQALTIAKFWLERGVRF